MIQDIETLAITKKCDKNLHGRCLGDNSEHLLNAPLALRKTIDPRMKIDIDKTENGYIFVFFRHVFAKGQDPQNHQT